MRVLVAVAVAVVAVAGCRGAEPERGPQRYALLVGCTWYRNVPGAFLQGPSNDLKLMQRLLVDQFRFQATDIRVLDDNADGDEQRPTRANIEREFRKLAEVAGRDDDVVIYLAGHGAFQPNNDPQNPADMEPDGRDEVFCPTDVARITGSESGPIPNGISDDEIHVWLDRILAKQASVWFIVDACHSGTVMRGNGESKDRAISPSQLGMDPARTASGPVGTRGSAPLPVNDANDRTFELTAKAAHIVATYAAQPGEPTPELPLPKRTRDQEIHGLFTYTLAQVLMEARSSLTYRELMGRVHAQYVQWGYARPNPSVEGPDADREVLGKKKWVGRSRILLQRDERNRFCATAGVIGGLSEGTILAVYPPPGTPTGDRPLGYVRVDEARMLESVVTPCRFRESPARSDLPEGGRCEIAQVSYGDARLRVSVDGPAFAEQGMAADGQRLRSILQNLERKDPRVDWTDDLSEADWLLRPWKKDVYLIPAGGLPWQPDEVDLKDLRPIPNRESEWFDENLTKIARAENLLRIGSRAHEEKLRGTIGAELDVELEIVKLGGQDRSEETPLRWGPRGRVLSVGDAIHIRVKNCGLVPVDVTLLFVDSSYGIEAFDLIRHSRPDNRLKPGEEDRTIAFRVTPSTVGLEHLVAIAVRARGEIPTDFSWLRQTTADIGRVRSGVQEDGGDPNSPLGPLLQGMYAAGQTRGLEPERTKEAVIKVLSWRTAEQ